MDTSCPTPDIETRLARARAMQTRLETVLERELAALEALPPGKTALDIHRSARAVSALAKAYAEVDALPGRIEAAARTPLSKVKLKVAPVTDHSPKTGLSPDGLVPGQAYGPGGHWREPTQEERDEAVQAAKREVLRRVLILEQDGLLHTIGEAADRIEEIPPEEQLTWSEFYAGKRAKGQPQ
ncbi:MAG: hypothetical protein ACK41P_03700 [Asticcacaulis sp.]